MAMTFNSKSYLDLAGLTRFWGKVKTYVDTADAQVLKDAKAYADGLASNYDVAGSAAQALVDAKAYADGLAVNYDAAGSAASALTDAKAYTDALRDGAVKTNTDAIAVLNGEGDGSVKKQVADAVAGIVANAPENLDTLKEIADYIAGDGSDAAGLVNRVAANEAAITVLNGEGDGSVKKALADAKAYTDDTVAGLDAEVTSADGALVTVKVTEVDGVVTAVNVTDANVASKDDVTAAYNAITSISDGEIDALFTTPAA